VVNNLGQTMLVSWDGCETWTLRLGSRSRWRGGTACERQGSAYAGAPWVKMHSRHSPARGLVGHLIGHFLLSAGIDAAPRPPPPHTRALPWTCGSRAGRAALLVMDTQGLCF
jgi:hypothetical protein